MHLNNCAVLAPWLFFSRTLTLNLDGNVRFFVWEHQKARQDERHLTSTSGPGEEEEIQRVLVAKRRKWKPQRNINGRGIRVPIKDVR